MLYVALLRGINVGGKNKIDMKSLKQVFEQAGMATVKTYINTGNILFTHSSASKQELTAVLENAIYNNFNLRIKVLLYKMEEFKSITNSIPKTWTNDKQMKSDVLFLWEGINQEKVLQQFVFKPEIDHVQYVPGALLWSVDRDKTSQSGISKIVGSALYKQVTIRNINTVRKIYALMQEMETK